MEVWRLAIHVPTGILIEAQSGGYDVPELRDRRLNTLLMNAVNAGYNKDEVLVKFGSSTEFETLFNKSQPPPTQTKIDRKLIRERKKSISQKAAIDSLKAEGLLKDYIEL